MGEFTAFGFATWDWLPFVDLPYRERNLWLALYTSGPAKRLCPGLWHGDHYLMASCAKMPPSDVLDALDELLRRRLVEYDRRLWVLRMTDLPDAGERPISWKALKGMWNGFRTVPRSPVRDRHVPMMKWLVDQGSKNAEMEKTWNATFGTIPVPSEPPSSMLLSDSDTGTRLQPGLFSNRALLLGSGMTSDSESIHQGSGSDQEPDLDQGQDQELEALGRPRYLQLVPDPTPDEIASKERADRATDLWDAVRAAGGDQLAPKL